MNAVKTRSSLTKASESKNLDWDDFVARNRVQIDKIAQFSAPTKAKSNRDEGYSDEFVQSFFDAMIPTVITHPLSKDIEHLRNGISSVLKLQTEKILEEPEAKALVDFIIGKFIERRFDRILQKVFPGQDSKRWFYRSCKTHFVK